MFVAAVRPMQPPPPPRVVRTAPTGRGEEVEPAGCSAAPAPGERPRVPPSKRGFVGALQREPPGEPPPPNRSNRMLAFWVSEKLSLGGWLTLGGYLHLKFADVCHFLLFFADFCRFNENSFVRSSQGLLTLGGGVEGFTLWPGIASLLRHTQVRVALPRALFRTSPWP